MSAHTPGPWFAEHQFGAGKSDFGFDILQAREPGDYSYRGCVARVFDAEHIEGITKAERDANARLIAAAPDLLQALLNLVGTMCAADGTDMEADLDAIDARVIDARAAIAKATGEQT